MHRSITDRSDNGGWEEYCLAKAPIQFTAGIFQCWNAAIACLQHVGDEFLQIVVYKRETEKDSIKLWLLCGNSEWNDKICEAKINANEEVWTQTHSVYPMLFGYLTR